MNDSNRYQGPSDGDYASYVEKLNNSGGGQPAEAGQRPAAAPQAGRTGAEGGAASASSVGDTSSVNSANSASNAGGAVDPVSPVQRAEPPLRAPRFIGLLLIIAAWVLFFLALKLGIQAWHARTGHMDEWLPAGFALIAARLLLAMGKAARNPRMRPQDPKKSFPEHIEY
jgi:hypothetical protein